jgi:segregation and condensation protein B
MEYFEKIRILEALLFAAPKPLSAKHLLTSFNPNEDIEQLLLDLQSKYEDFGINLKEVAGKWMFRTATDLSFLLRKEVEEEKKLSRAAIETLAIIAYHQPVTRAEIEDIRGVGLSKGVLDVIIEASWVKPKGRRRSPGRPMTYGTTENFLIYFGLNSVKDLPGIAELKAAGFLSNMNNSRLKLFEDDEISSVREHQEELQIAEHLLAELPAQ